MYCKSCGAENPSSANYCVNDGAALRSIPIKYKGKERNSIYCSNCGSKSTSLSNYCENCGESFTQYGREKSFIPKLATARTTSGSSVWMKLPEFQLQYLKKAAVPALIAIIVTFIISFAMMQSSEKAYNDMLNYELQNNNMSDLGPEVSGLLKAGKFFGISDILMLANLQNPDISFKASGGTGIESGTVNANVLLSNGYLIYLLIPFIGLLAAGIFSGRKNNRMNLTERLYDGLGIAVLYSVFLTLVSFFAGFSFHGHLNLAATNVSLDIKTNYSSIKTFFMTLLFGFLFSSLGILFSINFKKAAGHLEDWIPSGQAIHQAIVVPFIGSSLLFIGFFIYLSNKYSQFKDQILGGLSGTPLADAVNRSTGMIATLSVQLASYVWNLLHFVPVTFSLQAKNSTGSISYSIFSGLSATGAGQDGLVGMETSLSTTDIEMYLKFALLIPIALFIWTGFRMSKKPFLIKNLFIFSIVYAVIMSGISIFSEIGLTTGANAAGSALGNAADNSVNMSMNLGFAPMATFISSLIFSFVFAYLGSWITKLKASN